MRILCLAFVLLSGCASFEWRLQSGTPWTDGDWTRAFGAPLALRSEGETLFATAEEGVYAMKAHGEKLWAVSLPKGKRSLAVAEGKVVVCGEGHVTLFENGAQLWDQALADLSPPAIARGKVAVVSGNQLVALDLASGQILWRQPIAVEALVKQAQFSHVAPVIAGDRVCAGLAWEFNVLELANGNRGAHEDATGGGVSASLAEDGARCYFPQSRSGEGFGAGSNSISAVDPMKQKWTADWTVDLGKDLGVANVIVASGMIYARTDHRVAAIAGGKIKWMVRDDEVRSQPLKQTSSALDLQHGTVLNEAPGTNFAFGEGKIFAAARLDDKLRPRDVVTVLDAASGEYLGSWDGAGSVVRDFAVVGHALVIATSDGLRSVSIDLFKSRPR
jgi:outer membrane protein assembly factor BamB